MEKDKIEHAVVYAYNYQAHIGYFDTAEDAKRKVSQNDIYELRDRV